jgi:hypothetical protein
MNIRGTSLTAAAFVAVAAAAVGFVAPAAGQSSGSGGLSSGSGDLSSGSGSSCFRRDVTPLLTWGWNTPDPEDAATPEFVVGPDSVEGNESGRGSLDVSTTSTEPVVDFFHPGNDTPLSEVVGFDLSYSFASGGEFGPTYQLRLFGMNRVDEQADGFTTLLWTPEANGGFTPNTWTQRSNLATGLWRSTAAIAGQPGGELRTLAAILGDNPGGYVIEYGTLFGSSAGNITLPGYVDTFNFGCAQWDFEPGLFSGSAGSSGSGSGSSGSGS